ncbi:putative uroporphyrin-III C/tetrapyrrole (Corrin/Porphyrin) methyltransferase [Burkholderia pseudomallei MSHR5855]|nr:putative uroporphyrin-III C/tetrapyrrole (Corrin/Porphyrin) methyltransferase [Burkholderia pseudomallei MSHR5855]AIP43283.1 putative uroporphyrin-III C/tetrapyrrole (Corrin/Porphyrin) methyltransferase [Burkholderia pseudomallei MSHR5848]
MAGAARGPAGAAPRVPGGVHPGGAHRFAHRFAHRSAPRSRRRPSALVPRRAPRPASDASRACASACGARDARACGARRARADAHNSPVSAAPRTAGGPAGGPISRSADRLIGCPPVAAGARAMRAMHAWRTHDAPARPPATAPAGRRRPASPSARRTLARILLDVQRHRQRRRCRIARQLSGRPPTGGPFGQRCPARSAASSAGCAGRRSFLAGRIRRECAARTAWEHEDEHDGQSHTARRRPRRSGSADDEGGEGARGRGRAAARRSRRSGHRRARAARARDPRRQARRLPLDASGVHRAADVPLRAARTSCA